jgi:hypothetical protein
MQSSGFASKGGSNFGAADDDLFGDLMKDSKKTPQLSTSFAKPQAAVVTSKGELQRFGV